MRTDGRYSYRTDLYDETAELLGESAQSKGLDAACEFTQRMLLNLERDVEHDDMTPKLAEVISSPTVRLKYEIVNGIEISE